MRYVKQGGVFAVVAFKWYTFYFEPDYTMQVAGLACILHYVSINFKKYNANRIGFGSAKDYQLADFYSSVGSIMVRFEDSLGQ